MRLFFRGNAYPVFTFNADWISVKDPNSGRVSLLEILAFDDELDELVARGVNRSQVKARALAGGFRTMLGHVRAFAVQLDHKELKMADRFRFIR